MTPLGWLGRKTSTQTILKKQSDLDLHYLSLNMRIYINNLDQVSDWLKIRGGCGILIYSAWQDLKAEGQTVFILKGHSF